MRRLPYQFDAEALAADFLAWGAAHPPVVSMPGWLIYNLADTRGDDYFPFDDVPGYTRAVIQTLQGRKLWGAAFNFLGAWTAIPPHEQTADRPCLRLHVAVITAPGCWLVEEGNRYHLEAGACCHLNTRVRHCAVNESELDRIHLIVDAEVSE